MKQKCHETLNVEKSDLCPVPFKCCLSCVRFDSFLNSALNSLYLRCLNTGAPENHEFSIWDKCKINGLRCPGTKPHNGLSNFPAFLQLGTWVNQNCYETFRIGFLLILA